jgi:predicted Zn-dependent peptidase
MESRLRKLLVDPGIAVGANASPDSKPDIFEFFVQMAEGHPAEEALKIIDQEIASLKSVPIGKEPFERALNQERLSVYHMISDNSALGNMLGEYLMLSGNYLRGFEILEAYKKLSPPQLRAVAKEYFKKQNRAVIFMRPAKEKNKENKRAQR